MIKATELRIGNKLISGTSVGYYTVCMIEEFGTICFAEMDGHSYDLEDNDIRPVTLTPEILEKCGFEKEDGCYDICLLKEGEYPILYTHPATPKFYLRDWDGDSADCIAIMRDVRYLHQLQNLFFSLTGEELNCQL